MNNRIWVEKFLWSIIVLNIFVLAYVFLIPRTQFMLHHWGKKPEALMETKGALDTPNQYYKSYKVANEIRKVTGEGAIIFISVGSEGLLANQSVVIQRLYPRKVYFLGDPKGQTAFVRSSDFSNAFIVFNKSQGLCNKESVKGLLPEGLGICQAGK